MPNVSLVIPETEQSISRPIVMDIVRQIQDITKIPATSRILFPGDSPTVVAPGSAISDKEEDRTKFLSHHQVEITVEEDHDIDYITSTATTRPEHNPIFFDESIGVVARPIYSRQSVTINFVFRSMSKSAAKRFRDDLRLRVSMMRDIQLRDVTYHYTLPKDVVAILKEMNRLIELTDGYGEDFETYFQRCATTRATKITNQSGTVEEIAIAEKQMRIVGYFDFEGMPDKTEQDNDTGTTTISFSYKFQYEKPIACNIRYPIIVHNTLVDDDYLPFKAYDDETVERSFSFSSNAMYYFEAQTQVSRYVNTKATFVIPEHDEFKPNTIPKTSVAIFAALCTVDPDDKKALLNLKELGDVTLDSEILDFIAQSELLYVTTPYKSPFLISYYRDNKLIDKDAITIDANLNVSCINDMSFRSTHRIRLSIITDLDLLTPEAIKRLKKFPSVAEKLLQAVAFALNDNQGLSDIKTNKFITFTDVLNFINIPRSVPGKSNYPLSKNNGGNTTGSGTPITALLPISRSSSGSSIYSKANASANTYNAYNSINKNNSNIQQTSSPNYIPLSQPEILDRPDSWYNSRLQNEIQFNTMQLLSLATYRR